MVIVNNILKFIIFVCITFFACQIVTDGKKRISYIGTLLICFSSSIVQYLNSGLVEAIFGGELILVSIDKLLLNTKYQCLYSISTVVRNSWFFIAF